MDSMQNKMERIEALKKGDSIQHLLNEAAKILGNPILTHDMEYKVIAYTDNVVTDDPIWCEFDAKGCVGPHWLEFYKNECFFDTAANAQKITFLRSPKLKYDRIFGKFFNCDGIQIGCGVIVENNRPFDNDDPVLFEAFCDALNEVIAKNEFFRTYGQEYQQTLINELIDGNIEDKEAYTAHVESVYMYLKEHIYLAVVDSSRLDPEHVGLSALLDKFKRAQSGFKYSVYGNYVVIIMSSDKAQFDVNTDFGGLSELLGQNGIRVGISGSFDNLYELRRYYGEAVSALNCEPAANSGIFLYDADQ